MIPMNVKRASQTLPKGLTQTTRLAVIAALMPLLALTLAPNKCHALPTLVPAVSAPDEKEEGAETARKSNIIALSLPASAFRSTTGPYAYRPFGMEQKIVTGEADLLFKVYGADPNSAVASHGYWNTFQSELERP